MTSSRLRTCTCMYTVDVVFMCINLINIQVVLQSYDIVDVSQISYLEDAPRDLKLSQTEK